MARNTVSALLDECLRHGLVTLDDCGYQLMGDYFINDSLRKEDKAVFETLEAYCQSKGATLRTYKSRNRVALEMIGASYSTLKRCQENPHCDLLYNLDKQCPDKLPHAVSIEYFLKPLRLQKLYDQYLLQKQNKPTTTKEFVM